jgi:hypothetical protein
MREKVSAPAISGYFSSLTSYQNRKISSSC